jgi:hypothetical protein
MVCPPTWSLSAEAYLPLTKIVRLDPQTSFIVQYSKVREENLMDPFISRRESEILFPAKQKNIFHSLENVM